MITLSNLSAVKKKSKKRVGRGNASGHGTYSTRGIKGQRSRTGGRKRLVAKGFKNTLRRLPKNKGFKSLANRPVVVNLKDLAKHFFDGQLVRPIDLKNKQLIKDLSDPIKILGTGKLTKKLIISAQQFSKTAKTAIIKAGGQVKIIK